MLFQALNDAALLHGPDVRPSEEDVRSVEEERIQVLNNIEELEQKIKELDNQIEESAREVKRSSTDAALLSYIFSNMLYLSCLGLFIQGGG